MKFSHHSAAWKEFNLRSYCASSSYFSIFCECTLIVILLVHITCTKYIIILSYGQFYFPFSCHLECVNCSVVSDSLRPNEQWSARLLSPWMFQGKNIGVGSHSLLQGIFPTQGQNPGLLLAGRFWATREGLTLLVYELFEEKNHVYVSGYHRSRFGKTLP